MFSTVHLLVFLVLMSIVAWSTRLDEDKRHHDRRP